MSARELSNRQQVSARLERIFCREVSARDPDLKSVIDESIWKFAIEETDWEVLICISNDRIAHFIVEHWNALCSSLAQIEQIWRYWQIVFLQSISIRFQSRQTGCEIGVSVVVIDGVVIVSFIDVERKCVTLLECSICRSTPRNRSSSTSINLLLNGTQ